MTIDRHWPPELVSLYLPAPAGSFPPPLLVHEGELPTLPEMADLDVAELFSAEQNASPLEPVASRGERGWLVRFPPLSPLPKLIANCFVLLHLGQRRPGSETRGSSRRKA